MVEKPENKAIFDLVGRDLGLQNDPQKKQITYEELLDMVSDRVAHLLASSPERLFSLLYRLDVSERKVDEVMKGQKEISTNVGLAELIIQRQKERLHTKKKWKQEDIDDWERW
mgnify:CR=1 FL=1